MNIYVVLHYYNARTDTHVAGVFETKELAVKYVLAQIKESKQLDPTQKWLKPKEHCGDIVYLDKDYDESYEISCHKVQTADSST